MDEAPNGCLRAVKRRKAKGGESRDGATAELVRGAVAETLRYSARPADMVAEPEWFLELTRQTHERRCLATCGPLKDVTKLDQVIDAYMVIRDGAGSYTYPTFPTKACVAHAGCHFAVT